MEEEIIEKVRRFVEEECMNPTSKYGYEPFEFHFVPVANYCGLLAEGKGLSEEQKEICILSGWLHDIGSIIFRREDHHITSSEVAEKKLREFGYPEDKIKIVKVAIFTHRGSQGMEPESVEGEILQEADSMDAFDRISGMFKAAFVYERLDQKQAVKSIKGKLVRKYHQLSGEGKSLVKEKFDAAMILLNCSNEEKDGS